MINVVWSLPATAPESYLDKHKKKILELNNLNQCAMKSVIYIHSTYKFYFQDALVLGRVLENQVFE